MIVCYCILIAVLNLICMHQILDKKRVEVISSDSWLQIAPQYELIPDHSDQSDQKWDCVTDLTFWWPPSCTWLVFERWCFYSKLKRVQVQLTASCIVGEWIDYHWFHFGSTGHVRLGSNHWEMPMQGEKYHGGVTATYCLYLCLCLCLCNDEEDAGSMLTVPLQRRQLCRSE